jgi:putative addiction module component (TIGR02574 family)
VRPAATAAQQRLEADADLAALDPRSLSLVRWPDVRVSLERLSNLPGRAIFRFVANAVQIPPPGFDDLTPEEKVTYVGALWDRVLEDQQHLPVTEAQRVLLRERLAAHEADPSAARSWSEVRRDVERALASRSSR